MKKLTSQGYVRLWKPEHPLADKYGVVLEHRMVYFDHHGSIPPGFQIHHKNEIKTDNRIENLVAISNSEHQLQHRVEGSEIKNQYGTFKVKPVEERISTKSKKKAEVRLCELCASQFNMKRSDARFCSSRCQVTSFKQRTRKLGLR